MDELASYLPSFLLSSLQRDVALPSEERRRGVLLFADISGFTPLTERLAQQGPDGAEALSSILNSYFGALIDIIDSYGGDIVRFAGDAPLVIWFIESDEELRAATLCATECALRLQEQLGEKEVAPQTKLSLRIGIGVGDLSVYLVGGLLHRWEVVVAGDPLSQVVAAEQAARPGEVLLSREAYSLLHERATGDILTAKGQEFLKVRACELASLKKRERSDQTPELARSFVPRPARSRLDANLAGSLAELRRVSILFLQISQLLSPPYARLSSLQEAFCAIQEEVYRYGGSINQFLVDDKGTTLLAVWGLPTCTHEDNAARAIQASLSLQQWLSSRGIMATGGVSSSRVFAGDRGSSIRREYAVIGKGVNLAARLMQAAPSGGILCDEVTTQEAARRVSFEERAPVLLKGWSAPVRVFRPTQEKKREGPSSSMIGRQRELQMLRGTLEPLSHGGTGLGCIEGEAGIGKTQLISAFLASASEMGLRCLLGAGSSIEVATPYFAWRSVLGQLLLRDEQARPAALVERLNTIFTNEPSNQALLPLLQALLPLDLEETPQTLQMDKQVRGENLHRLIISLLQRETAVRPLVIVLDDLHWFDTSSLELARLAAREVQRLCFLFATRPVLDTPTASYQQLLSMPSLVKVTLETLPREEIGLLVTRRLGATALSAEVEAFLYEKTKGHPFFSEELAYALRDLGVIVLYDGVLRLAPEKEFSQLQFPETLNGVIASRIDRLTPAQQLLIKTASVIGRVFSQQTLLEIRALQTEDDSIVQELEVLRKLDLTLLETPEPRTAYLFKHILTQEVAYNLLLFSQRRALHRAVALWYEQSFADELSPYYALLSYHWQKAEDFTKALLYTERAGEQALQNFANEEAVRFFQEALRLADKVKVDDLRRERWERQIGEALYGMGRLEESRSHLLQALILLGSPVPPRLDRFMLDLGRQLFAQVAHRVYQRRSKHTDREILLESARVYEVLSLTYYFGDDVIRAAYGALQNTNILEEAGPSRELARAYASLCMAAGLVPVHKVAALYEKKSKEIATRERDKQTLSWVLQATGAYHVGCGHWRQATEDLTAAHQLYEELGDHRGCDQEKAILAWGYHAQGDYAKSTRLYTETYLSAKKRDDPQAQNWGLCGQSENALHQGQEPVQIVSLMEEAKSLLRYRLGRPEAIRVFGLLALAYYRRGDRRQAKETAKEGLSRVSLLVPPTSFYSLEGYSGLAETMLSLWKDGDTSMIDETLHACRGMASYARVFFAGAPRAAMLWGLYDAQRKNPKSAARSWKKGIQLSRELKRPFEEDKLQRLLSSL